MEIKNLANSYQSFSGTKASRAPKFSRDKALHASAIRTHTP